MHRNHYSPSGSAVLTPVSLPKQLFNALSHTSCIVKTRAKNWILRPYFVTARWIEEESTVLVTNTFCVLTGVIKNGLQGNVDTWETKEVKRMCSLLNPTMNVKNTFPSLRHHFCPPLQGAFSSEVSIPHVATLNTSNFCCLFSLPEQESSAVICMSSVRFFYIFIGWFLRFASICLFHSVRCKTSTVRMFRDWPVVWRCFL